MLWCLAVFLCGVTDHYGTLLVARVLTGVGEASLLGLGFVHFHSQQLFRGKAFELMRLTLPIAAILSDFVELIDLLA